MGHEGLTTKCKTEAWLGRLCQQLSIYMASLHESHYFVLNPKAPGSICGLCGGTGD